MSTFEISKVDEEKEESFSAVLPSLLMSLAKPAAWLPESCEELLKDDGGRLDTNALSQPSVHQSESRKKAEKVRRQIHDAKVNIWSCQQSQVCGATFFFF